MTIFTGIILYLIIWWTVLFAILPMKITSKYSPDPAEQTPGTPDDPKMGYKFIVTSLVAAGFWVIFFILVQMEIIDFQAIARAMMIQDNVEGS